MGENASATEGSKSSESDARSDTKTKSESTTTVQRTPDVPAAKGHGSDTGPEALGIDRMADQERKRRERNLGPATVRRMEQRGEIDREPSDFQREAADLASRIADDHEPQVDRSADESGGETASVSRSAEGEGAGGGGGGSGGGASSLVQNVVSSSGTSLNPGVRGEMESKMGTNFGDVRVHTGKKAGKAAEAIDARAFTVGNHIGFNHGEFDTSSPEGRHTIAHELAHVQQQAGQTRRMAQRVQEGSGLEVSHPKDPHEQEAERVAREVMRGESAEVNRIPRASVSPRVDRFGEGIKSALGMGGEGMSEEQKKKLKNLGLDAGQVGVTAGSAALGGILGGPVGAAIGAGGGEIVKKGMERAKSDTGVSGGSVDEIKQQLLNDPEFIEGISNQVSGGQTGGGGTKFSE